jgi:imidazolonepropionase
MRQVLLDARLLPDPRTPDLILDDAALAWRDGVIEFAGPRSALRAAPDDVITRCERDLLLPALIDCHTHAVWAGDRIDEFAERQRGASYADIARRGGGILATVRATRAASEAQLIEAALPRVKALIAGGVATIEIKSGYGLDFASETKMLRVARALGQLTGARVVTTLLALHALPPEFEGRRGAYVRAVATEWLPLLLDQGLVDQVDVFIESIGFSVEEARVLFRAAERLGCPIKAHAEQLTLTGASALAAEFRALSVDHVEYLDALGVRALADAGTIAVLLPSAFFALKETQLPPIAALRAAGVPLAVATDLNPGTGPQRSLTAALNQACVLFGLRADEALLGATLNAARALGVHELSEGLQVGTPADVARFSIARWEELCYWQSGVSARAIYCRGRLIG